MKRAGSAIEVSLLEVFVLGLLGLAAIYVAAWLAARAFFDNKAEYNRKLLRDLEREDGTE